MVRSRTRRITFGSLLSAFALGVASCGASGGGLPNHFTDDQSGGRFTVPAASIRIDGTFADWPPSSRVYEDLGEPICNGLPGVDIREIYLAQDDTYIFLRFVLAGPPRWSFTYRAGTNERHIWVGELCGKLGIGSSFDAFVTLPPADLRAVGRQFECRVHKDLLEGLPLSGLKATADADPGGQSPCRDTVMLPELVL